MQHTQVVHQEQHSEEQSEQGQGSATSSSQNLHALHGPVLLHGPAAHPVCALLPRGTAGNSWVLRWGLRQLRHSTALLRFFPGKS